MYPHLPGIRRPRWRVRVRMCNLEMTCPFDWLLFVLIGSINTRETFDIHHPGIQVRCGLHILTPDVKNKKLETTSAGLSTPSQCIASQFRLLGTSNINQSSSTKSSTQPLSIDPHIIHDISSSSIFPLLLSAPFPPTQ